MWEGGWIELDFGNPYELQRSTFLRQASIRLIISNQIFSLKRSFSNLNWLQSTLVPSIFNYYNHQLTNHIYIIILFIYHQVSQILQKQPFKLILVLESPMPILLSYSANCLCYYNQMKTAQSFNTLVNPHLTNKYIPSPETAEMILAYFVYNNFQDFNTWQQIAKTKVEYDYSQNQKGMFICRTTLKWEDRPFPTIVESSQAKSKKTAKKRALGKLIENVIYQGYIGLGFRQDNFAQKLPRRRKNESDDSSEDGEQERYPFRTVMRQLLISGNILEALTALEKDNLKWKHIEAFECWNHGLRIGSVSFLRQVLRILQKIPLTSEQRNEQIMEMTSNATRQYFYGKQVKDPLVEDLTDFIRYYQLQKPPTIKNINRKPDIRPQPIPSQQVLALAQTHSPTRQQLISNFHPIEGRKLFLHPLQQHAFLPHYHLQLPKFEEPEKEIPIKIVELLYSLLFYYCRNYDFLINVIQMMETEIKNIGIVFSSTVKAQYRQKGESYYLKNKNLLSAQFLLLLHTKLQNYKWNVSIEGMLVPHKYQQHLFGFNCKEPEDIVNKKINRKSNLSQFEEMREISVNEFVLLVSKFGDGLQLVAQVVQLIPTFKLYIPALVQDFTDPYPFTLVKLYNSKIYQKASSSIIQVAKNCIELIENETTLLWQPPSYSILSVIVELLVEWMTAKCTVLIISMNCQALHGQLSNLDVKAVKLTAKTQQKMMAKYNIVIAYPGTVCCDLLKNYAFTRVLIEGANQISEIMSLAAIVKGCKKLYLMGDPFLPRMTVQSPYCKSRGMDISLFERLYNSGTITQTFFSRFQNNMEFNNVMEWANKYLYNRKLLLIGNQQQTPIIKGFPWPSYNYRVCLLHHTNQSNQQDYLNNQAFICSFICAQVVKSGYTNLDQITCSTAEPRALGLLHFHISELLKMMQIADQKLFVRYMSRLARHITGSSYFRSDLSIMMTGANSSKLSFRQILGALHEGNRGVIIIGDAYRLGQNEEWSEFINWCYGNKLISRIQL